MIGDSTPAAIGSFAAADPPDWSFLSDGSGTFFIEHHRPDFECPYSCCPSFWGTDIDLTTVEILVELGGNVALETSSWGAVKARYR